MGPYKSMHTLPRTIVEVDYKGQHPRSVEITSRTSHHDLKIRQAETFEEDALTGVELAG